MGATDMANTIWKGACWIVIAFVLFMLQGCATGYQKFYAQVAPSKYSPTQRLMIFEYNNVDINEIYELFFNDFLIIGNSGFNGPFENPQKSASYAKSIGADVLITAVQYKETRTALIPMTTPTISITQIDGYSGSGSFSGTATTFGTQTTSIPVAVRRYNQKGLFLKNVKNILPIWEKVKAQYKKTDTNELEGIWYNEYYKIEMFQSGDKIVGFLTEKPSDRTRRKYWEADQLKIMFGVDSKVGVFLLGTKTPYPAKFRINNFGHFEVSLVGGGIKISFQREN